MTEKAILKNPFKQKKYSSCALLATSHVLSAHKCLLAPCPFKSLLLTLILIRPSQKCSASNLLIFKYAQFTNTKYIPNLFILYHGIDPHMTSTTLVIMVKIYIL